MPRREISLDELNPTDVLAGDMTNKAGEVVFAAGTTLDKYELIALKSVADAKYYLETPNLKSTTGDAAAESSGTFVQDAAESDADSSRLIRVDSLRSGMKLTQSLFDLQGVLLLASGSRITGRFLMLLQQRSISVVESRDSDHPTAPPELSDQSAECPADVNRLPLADMFAEAQAGLEKHVAASALVGNMTTSMLKGTNASSDSMREVISGFVDQITLDKDLLTTIVGLKRTEGEYLFDHAVNVALLSMSIGASQGLESRKIQELGLGAILQDVGMLALGDELRLAPRAYTPEERRLLQNHPEHTLKYLEKARGLPAVAAHIGYQVHERADGSGYPRGRRITTTHPFARIVGVADTFCAMTRPRPHREAIMPHVAIREMLQLGRQGRFDRSVLRSLLDCVAAFPIGSIVELSDGRIVRVVRANRGKHTRPVVAEINANDLPSGEEINLADTLELTIVREMRNVQSCTSFAA